MQVATVFCLEWRDSLEVVFLVVLLVRGLCFCLVIVAVMAQRPGHGDCLLLPHGTHVVGYRPCCLCHGYNLVCVRATQNQRWRRVYLLIYTRHRYAIAIGMLWYMNGRGRLPFSPEDYVCNQRAFNRYAGAKRNISAPAVLGKETVHILHQNELITRSPNQLVSIRIKYGGPSFVCGEWVLYASKWPAYPESKRI